MFSSPNTMRDTYEDVGNHLEFEHFNENESTHGKKSELWLFHISRTNEAISPASGSIV